MQVLPNQILIRADKDQKQSVVANGMKFFIVPNRGTYEQNGIETNPCVAEVVAVGDNVPLHKGDLVVLHHNLITDKAFLLDTASLVGESDAHLSVSVIPYDRWVLATVDASGELVATEFNFVCERIPKPETVFAFEVPESAKQNYSDKVKVLSVGGLSQVAVGDTIGILKYADYPVAYAFNNEIKRCCVVWKEDVVCYIPKRDQI
jgi:hypothetical protein